MSQAQQRKQQKAQGVPMPLPANDHHDDDVPQQQPKVRSPQRQPVPAPRQQQQPMPSHQQQEDLMNSRFMTSLQALMGPPVAQQRPQPANKKPQPKKERLPSLHIGNLPDMFYDLDLFKYIRQAGHRVHKAFVVLDKKTQKNCTYGYAQFLTEAEADKCQAALNNAVINGKTITVSKQVDSKPNPKANVFVRNLPPKATQSELFALYSKFGAITKCKLECYADGTSRGFAYVQFEHEKDSAAAIAATNGSELHGKKLEVFAHEKKTGKDAPGQKTNNNVFVQGLPKGTDEAKLKALFAEFGEISSALVQHSDSDDAMVNNGFVCFADPAAASAAIAGLHKKKLPSGSFLLVCPHVAKRENDMTADKSNAPIQQNMKKAFDSNLFIKNIPVEAAEQEILKVFSEFGTVISVKVKTKRNSAQARFKHAFVLYETVEMAQNAIRNLDQSRALGITPIEVQFWVSRVDLQQEREDRQKQEMKRLIQSGLHDLQAHFLGGQRGGRRGGYHQGRGGRQAQAGKPRPKSQPKSKSPERAKAFPMVALPAVDVAQLAAMENLVEKKQVIGNAVYPCIAAVAGEDFAGKITGMLLDENVVDLQKLVSNQKYLTDLVGEAVRLLHKQ